MDDVTTLDPEEATLAELEAAEESGADETESPAEEITQPEPPPTPAPSEEIRIPKPRLDAVLGRARELELENARLKGMVEAGAKRASEAAPQASPRSDPVADRLIAIETEKDALWRRYDQGEIGFAEMKQSERRLDSESTDIRGAIAQARRQAPHLPDINGDVRLAELTEEIANRNLWVGYIPADYMVSSVVPLAERLLAQRRIPVTADAVGTFRLRQATVEVAKAMGAYRLFAPREMWPEAGGQAAPQARQGRALSPRELQEKLSLARRQPPDASGIGTRLPSELVNPKDIDGMSEDELGALSDADLERLAPSRS